MIAIGFDQVELVIGYFSVHLDNFKTQIKESLEELMGEELHAAQKEYIQLIVANLSTILKGKPHSLMRLKNMFDNIIDPVIMADEANEDFRSKLLKCMGYSKRRSDFYPKYFNKLGLKVCVYCNAQLAVSVEIEEDSFLAKFQVDHYIPKSNYPCFSISLFNLYPSCSSCNNSKSQKEVQFELYKKFPENSSAFNFSLDMISVVDYFISHDHEDLKFKFNEPKLNNGYHSFESVFNISSIYATQMDVVEELVRKAQVYTEEYKDQLKREFPEIFTTPGMINRLLVGNYVDQEFIHKRPLSKFMIDICKEVGLI
ncbi:MAG: HNH endonuclease [Ferruginibacter sp.]